MTLQYDRLPIHKATNPGSENGSPYKCTGAPHSVDNSAARKVLRIHEIGGTFNTCQLRVSHALVKELIQEIQML